MSLGNPLTFNDSAIEPDDLLAERNYKIDGIGQDGRVIVRVGLPRRQLSDGYYVCNVEINDGERRFKAFGGEDALEALLTALTFVGIELWVLGGREPNGLAWEGRQDGGSNFPLPN